MELSRREADFIEEKVNDGRTRIGIEWLPDGDREARLQTRQFVGVVALPSGRQISIDSKVGQSNLLYLLRYAHGHDVTTTSDRTSLTEGETFLDVLALVYLDELDRVLQQGLVPDYRSTEQAVSHLRGNLDVQRQIQRQGPTPTAFECDFEEHTYDTPLNQTVLYAAHRLEKLVSSPEIGGQLRDRITRLRDRVELVTIDSATVESLTLTRLVDHYTEIVRMATMIIEGTFVDTFDPGAQVGSTTLLNMNHLYERVVERCAAAVASERDGWDVLTQMTVHSLVSGSPSVDLRPDFMLQIDGETKLVGDAKWKTTRQNSDIYQLVAYELAEVAPGMIVYPEQDGALETEYEIRGGDRLRLVELPVKRYANDFATYCEQLEGAFESELFELVRN